MGAGGEVGAGLSCFHPSAGFAPALAASLGRRRLGDLVQTGRPRLRGVSPVDSPKLQEGRPSHFAGILAAAAKLSSPAVKKSGARYVRHKTCTPH